MADFIKGVVGITNSRGERVVSDDASGLVAVRLADGTTCMARNITGYTLCDDNPVLLQYGLNGLLCVISMDADRARPSYRSPEAVMLLRMLSRAMQMARIARIDDESGFSAYFDADGQFVFGPATPPVITPHLSAPADPAIDNPEEPSS